MAARKKKSEAPFSVGEEVVLQAEGIDVAFGAFEVLKNLDISVYRDEILGLVGGSGSGKSILMRTILGLTKRQAGQIFLFGSDIEKLSGEDRLAVDRRLGVLFQHGALFSSLTVQENIQVPMREYFDLPQSLMDELAALKISLVGLPPEAAHKYPAELSGGMIKRAGLARALALDPDLLFLDEPTSGLDPIGAAEFDELLLSLRRTLGLTVFMVTHDLDSLHAICDRVAVLRNKKVLCSGSIKSMHQVDDPWVKAYFDGKRGRIV